MKKTLLFVLILGVTAFINKSIAQDGMSPATPVSHSVGATHGFKVNVNPSNDHLTDHANNYYTWKVFTIDGGTEVELTDFTKFQFVTYDPKGADFGSKFGSNIGTSGSYSAQNSYAIGVQWLDVLASGVYAVEVQEYNGIDMSSCSARRRFYVSVGSGDLDFILAALNASDFSEISGAPTESQLTACNTFSGNLIENDGSHTLDNSSIFYKVDMKTGTQDWNGQWGFDYDLANTNGTGVTVEVLNGTGVGATSVGIVDAVTNKITVNANNPTAYIKITFNNVLGIPGTSDVTLNFKEKGGTGNTTAYIVAGSNQFESDTNIGNNTQTISYVVKASPDTQQIAVD